MADTLKKNNEWDKPKLCFSPPPAKLNLILQPKKNQPVDTESIISQIVLARLGPAQENNYTQESGSDEYHLALSHLITDINITDFYAGETSDQTVVEGCVDCNGERKHVSSLLKDLQPHRERPSKDRAKRFAAGDISSDQPIPAHHDLQEFQYWATLPMKTELQAAKVFVLGQVVYISEGDSHCRSISSKNPNVSIIFLAYRYLPESQTFEIAGKSGLYKAAKVLLANVTSSIHINEGGSIILKEDLRGYEPYHEELDVQSRIPQTVHFDCSESEDTDPYHVERIVKKRFRNGQYEYQVKWCGYSENENTWELPNNIPSSMLSAFEKAQSVPSATNSRPRREGLRQTKKSTHRDDFIFNA